MKPRALSFVALVLLSGYATSQNAPNAAPVVKNPVAKAPMAPTPIAKAPVAPTPVAKAPSPVAPLPIAKAPVIATPVAKAPSPVAPIPVAKAPVAPTPIVTAPTPLARAPLAPTPVAKVPSPVATTPVTAPTPVAKAPSPVAPIPVAKAPSPVAPVPSAKAPVVPTPVAKAPSPVAAVPVAKAPVAPTPTVTAPTPLAKAPSPVAPTPVVKAPMASTPVVPVAKVPAPIAKAPSPLAQAPVAQAPTPIAKLPTPVAKTPVVPTPVAKAPSPVAPAPKASVPVAQSPTANTPVRKPTAAPQKPVPFFKPIRIRCGGREYTDKYNRLWLADQFYSGGSAKCETYDGVLEIPGTSVPMVYLCERNGNFFKYDIPVPAGDYRVVLRFAETREGRGKVKDRVFNINVENQYTETNFDIVQRAGGNWRAISLAFDGVAVVDGFLTIDFAEIPGFKVPKISAIEVLGNQSPQAPVVNSPTAKAPATAPISKAPVGLAPTTVATTAPVPKAPTDKPTSNPTRLPTRNPTRSPTDAPAIYEPIAITRIRCGGPDFTDSRGRLWLADQYFSGGLPYCTNSPISGTDDGPIYQCTRWGNVQYDIPVPVGEYSVVLHFAEIAFVNKRVFNIYVENQFAETNFDVLKRAGSFDTAISLSFDGVAVSDGFVTIHFVEIPGFDNPNIAAIEVFEAGPVPKSPVALSPTTKAPVHKMPTRMPTIAPTVAFGPIVPIRIRCGGPKYTDSRGQLWRADRYFSGGETWCTSDSILNTNDDGVYSCERWGSFQYDIPVSAGEYSVVLHFAEITFHDENRRVFNIYVENQFAETNFDVIKRAGGSDSAISLSFDSVAVSDGFVTIQFEEIPGFNFPKIGAIEVLETGSAPTQPPPTNAPVITAPNVPIRIHCGGSDFTDKRGQFWSADRYFSGGETWCSYHPIGGTDNDEVYSCERFGDVFKYDVPVPAGEYAVVLHFSESYYYMPGQRKFNINVENQFSETHFDIVERAGDRRTATYLVFQVVQVVDGFLTIDFGKIQGQPTINAIEVVETGSVQRPPTKSPVMPPTKSPVINARDIPIRIHCGGPEFTDKKGQLWLSDRYFSRGDRSCSNYPMAGTDNVEVYSCERYDDFFKYDIPVPAGEYRVVLHFAESYVSMPGQRKFNIYVEDQFSETYYDIVERAGGPKTATNLVVPIVQVSDGFLTIDFAKIQGVNGQPTINAIEVLEVE